ncbi:hypothetical protein [Pseudoxanthomonas sp. PXM02]|uniref:hypothetical protein n=1 Tax=Pseudoxanthomonas sp. PXM02 TaxID=2769294 RepID=UPI00177C5578|nr:hypothetical protein [Pseudoxanthomonas sp. PXM02]MBD9480562.1 hypothetical protein [Pseudoxanthomonas sp. PXM02]
MSEATEGTCGRIEALRGSAVVLRVSFGLLLLCLAGCGAVYTPGGPNMYSDIASEALVAQGYCETIADCAGKGLITTGRFEESGVSAGRYVTQRGIYIALHDVGPGLVEEISSEIGSRLSQPDVPCVRISKEPKGQAPSRRTQERIYVCRPDSG